MWVRPKGTYLGHGEGFWSVFFLAFCSRQIPVNETISFSEKKYLWVLISYEDSYVSECLLSVRFAQSFTVFVFFFFLFYFLTTTGEALLLVSLWWHSLSRNHPTHKQSLQLFVPVIKENQISYQQSVLLCSCPPCTNDSQMVQTLVTFCSLQTAGRKPQVDVHFVTDQGLITKDIWQGRCRGLISSSLRTAKSTSYPLKRLLLCQGRLTGSIVFVVKTLWRLVQPATKIGYKYSLFPER